MLACRQKRERRGGATRVATIVLLVVGAAIVVGGGYALGLKSRRAAAPPGDQAAAPAAQPAPAPSPPAERTPAPVPAPLGTDRGAERTPPAPPAAAPFRISPARIDFGNVSPGQPLSGSFTIVNVTERPLVVTSVAGDFSAQPRGGLDGSVIAPRGTLEVPVDVDYRTTMTGPRQSRVTVSFAEHPEPATVMLVAEVTRPVKASPAYLQATSEASGELVVESIDGKAFRVLAVNGRALEAVAPGAGGLATRHTLTWDLGSYDANTCRDAQGRHMPQYWVVETDHPGAPVVDVLVRHRCTFPERPPTNWRPADRRVVLGVIDPAAPLEFDVPIVPMRGAAVGDDPVSSVATELAGAAIELVGVSEEDEQSVCHLRLTVPPEHAGLLYATVKLSSSSGHATVTIIGSVRK